MKAFSILAILATLTVFSFAQQASAQAVPSISGLKAFSTQANYMSLAGYLRWQMFKESNVLISQVEATELVRLQAHTTE